MGGTKLTIHGNGFDTSPIYGSWCTWDGLPFAPARVLSSRVATCVAPAATEERRDHLDLRLNGAVTGSGVPFEFLNTPTVHAHPLLGPMHGGTYVSIQGMFLASAAWWCRFGRSIVPARRLTTERLQVCH